MSDLQNRRIFLQAAAAASAAWVTADLLQVDEALAWSAQHAGHGDAKSAATRAPMGVLTKAQADVIEAMTMRIMPSVDGRPGAREAGVVAFIDRSLSTFHADAKQLYLDGVQDLNRRATDKSPQPAGSFATLAAAQQDDILRAIEQTPFFQTVRFDTIIGMFALPTYGGNRDFAGWHMLGFEHQPAFQPPFGYYDAHK
jgi:gluconate 2-dehydrogenase gamma chain